MIIVRIVKAGQGLFDALAAQPFSFEFVVWILIYGNGKVAA